MRAYSLSLAFGLWSGFSASAPASIQGLWLTDDHNALVRIAPCARLMCGTVEHMLDRGPGVPKTDLNNPDPRLRTRPIVGMAILSGFQGAGGSWKGGRAYDPKSGKSYRSMLELQPDGSLKVSGCILFLCESRRWQRAR